MGAEHRPHSRRPRSSRTSRVGHSHDLLNVDANHVRVRARSAVGLTKRSSHVCLPPRPDLGRRATHGSRSHARGRPVGSRPKNARRNEGRASACGRGGPLRRPPESRTRSSRGHLPRRPGAPAALSAHGETRCTAGAPRATLEAKDLDGRAPMPLGKRLAEARDGMPSAPRRVFKVAATSPSAVLESATGRPPSPRVRSRAPKPRPRGDHARRS